MSTENNTVPKKGNGKRTGSVAGAERGIEYDLIVSGLVGRIAAFSLNNGDGIVTGRLIVSAVAIAALISTGE